MLSKSATARGWRKKPVSPLPIAAFSPHPGRGFPDQMAWPGLCGDHVIMSIPASSPLEQALTRQESPLSTEPWGGESAPHPDLDTAPPPHAQPTEPEATAGGTSGLQASQAMSQGQRSLNGTLHQHQMLNHLDIEPGDAPAASAAEDQSAAPDDDGHVSWDSIRLLAYQIYLRNNGEEGHALDHWLEAERQLAHRHGLPPEVD